MNTKHLSAFIISLILTTVQISSLHAQDAKSLQKGIEARQQFIASKGFSSDDLRYSLSDEARLGLSRDYFSGSAIKLGGISLKGKSAPSNGQMIGIHATSIVIMFELMYLDALWNLKNAINEQIMAYKDLYWTNDKCFVDGCGDNTSYRTAKEAHVHAIDKVKAANVRAAALEILLLECNLVPAPVNAYYNGTNPAKRLQFTTSPDMQLLFKEGDEILNLTVN